MQEKSTRQRILDVLLNQDQVTAAELGRILSLTQADVRYHLSRMVAEGLVVISQPRKSGRRGRPARRYNLASKSMQDNYELITRSLLEIIRGNYSDLDSTKIFQQIASQIAVGSSPGGPPSLRLLQMVELLNKLNYQARWEAHADAPRVIFDRCPYASLRPDYSELCRLDAVLLEKLLGREVNLVESNAHVPDGYCLFTTT